MILPYKTASTKRRMEAGHGVDLPDDGTVNSALRLSNCPCVRTSVNDDRRHRDTGGDWVTRPGSDWLDQLR